MGKYVIALDQGTTSSRCILFDKAGNIVRMAQEEFEQIYPKPGWVEHDPKEIWVSQLGVLIDVVIKSGIQIADISSIGITNQRETTIIWDRKTGEPVYNAIVWQCRRTAPIIDDLVNKGYSDMIKEKTGLVPDAYFSGSKIAWILDNVPGVRQRAENGELAFGTVDSWLVWNLTKGKVHVTDYTNASRTMLFNIHTLQWDEDLLKMLDIPTSLLPEVKPSSCLYGYADTEAIKNIPIAGIAGDQQAALFGQCCFEKGSVKNTYGTGCFLLMNTGKEAVRSRNGLLTTIAASVDENVEYALEGSVFVGGAAVQWLRDGLRMIDKAPDTFKYATKVESTDGVYLVPAFAGMGAPYWNQYARGIIVGLTRGCEKEHFIRATLESIAYQSYDVLKAMEEDVGVTIDTLKVDGGASANDFLMQFQSDILDSKVHRPECIETTALGAAYLAGLAVGFYESKDEIKKNWQLNNEFDPNIDSEERKELLHGWKRAVKCALAWAYETE
ncbi:MAG: glycerol kinase GlpK [Lachnospiraceae bacterium]|nr:glycerol kinase GlpK [Lachnospiraceae bacterium]